MFDKKRIGALVDCQWEGAAPAASDGLEEPYADRPRPNQRIKNRQAHFTDRDRREPIQFAVTNRRSAAERLPLATSGSAMFEPIARNGLAPCDVLAQLGDRDRRFAPQFDDDVRLLLGRSFVAHASVCRHVRRPHPIERGAHPGEARGVHVVQPSVACRRHVEQQLRIATDG